MLRGNMPMNDNAQAQASPTETEQGLRLGLPLASMQISAHEGPLPSPEVIRAYEDICPGAGKRILAYAEKEQQHRHDMEKTALEANIGDMRANRKADGRGQWMAFIVSIVAILTGGVIAICGYPFEGTILSGATLIGIVATFITRKFFFHSSEE